MVNLENVSFAYDKNMTISNLSFNIKKGEFVAVIGSNGAGKSTLCKLLNGILKPSSGSVVINGMDTRTTKTSTLAKHIGFLFQNPDRQICKNTVEEEILFGLELALNDKKLIKERLEKVLADFQFKRDSNPFQLSRGERQRVALASLIAVEPEILILDEPTTGLDYRECIGIMETIKELNSRGVTVITISHDMELVLDYAKRVLVLSGGRLIADGETKKVFRMPEILEQASIIPAQIVQLAFRLGEGFEDVFSVEEMISAVSKKMNKERTVANERVS
jgi:energy-coupling factor transport system ATP-binding protein